MTSSTVMEGILKNLKDACHQLFFHRVLNHYNLFAVEKFAVDDTFCKKPTQMRVNRCLDSFVNYHDDSILNNGNKNKMLLMMNHHPVQFQCLLF